MVRPEFLLDQYSGTYGQIKVFTAGITHSESLREVGPGINCLNWLVGHIVVARCNFLMFLDVPSIWGRDEIMRFIPGSAPISTANKAYPFNQLLRDLETTQDQLQKALEEVEVDRLNLIKEDNTIAEHLAFYAAHEAGHTGQIELISTMLKGERA